MVLGTLSPREVDRAASNAAPGLFFSLKESQATSAPRGGAGGRGGAQPWPGAPPSSPGAAPAEPPGDGGGGGGSSGGSGARAETVARAAQEVAIGSLLRDWSKGGGRLPGKRWLPLRWVYLPARWEVCDQPL